MNRIHIDHADDVNVESGLFSHSITQAIRKYIHQDLNVIQTEVHNVETWETEAGLFIRIERKQTNE